MIETVVGGAFFRPEDTLCCGQTFRWTAEEHGWLVFSADKACFLQTPGEDVRICTREEDVPYFLRYFDCTRDYAAIAGRAQACGGVVAKAAESGRGIRILNQDPEEMIFTFLLSQNNNIPRIRGMIERLCAALGKRCLFGEREYFSFPKAPVLAREKEDFYRALGFGYRAAFVAQTARRLAEEDTEGLAAMETPALREKLLTYPGIGPKVADCILLFGFHRTDAFPVDTWLEKVYREDFGGRERDRQKISAYFSKIFGEYGGYIQQYLFYAKKEGRL